ncbi:TetR/AcrR family transcriptional regulator C-terminal domain-containing protein [Smaragdicoccus niigatensis]|uniref:TetR/AcrR family transcriptional regulator C-terminal domain-containing protein n=1 Tax=Smaragdicoccus niigatensis TaxID=359359 RepID=UPI00036760FE|nr:TetR/AcrR family transcriptional regulator C-terminal domain-containing protein [Smaragdicoccus niigatensis]
MKRAEEIAAVLSERIATGRLRPGDRAPSTRTIMRDFGVAMATASRVLALLQDAGVVASTPGRGSVVLSPDESARAEPELTVDAVVAAALRIADSEGLEAASMRRVASEVGVATMALYRFVSGRDDLVLRMMDLACADLVIAESDPSHWRERLDWLTRQFWQCLRRHPWLASAMSMTRPQPLPNALPYSEAIIDALRTAGFSPADSLTMHLGLMNLVRGLAETVETELADQAATGITNDEWADTQTDSLLELMPSDRFPRMNELVQQDYPYDHDTIFEMGVRCFLDGVAWQVSQSSDAR